MREIAVIGGGLAGLTAAITAAEGGARVRLLVAHATLGGRARSTEGSYKANLGPHVLYKDGQLWGMAARARPSAAHGGASAERHPRALGGRDTAHPAAGLDSHGPAPALARRAIDRSFRDWVRDHSDERTAAMLSAGADVYTFPTTPASCRLPSSGRARSARC